MRKGTSLHKMARIKLALIILIFCAQETESTLQASCAPIMALGHLDDSEGNTMMMFDTPFTCSGAVSEIYFYAENAGMFYFDIWQKLNSTNFVLSQKVGINTPYSGRLLRAVLPRTYTRFLPGWIMGVHYSSSSASRVPSTILRDMTYPSNVSLPVGLPAWRMVPVIVGPYYNDILSGGVKVSVTWDPNTKAHIAIQPIIVADGCQSDPCHGSNSSCANVGNSGYFSCNCSDDRTGTLCETELVYNTTEDSNSTAPAPPCEYIPKLPEAYRTMGWQVALKNGLEVEASVDAINCRQGVDPLPVLIWSWKSLSDLSNTAVVSNSSDSYKRIKSKFSPGNGYVLRLPRRKLKAGLYLMRVAVNGSLPEVADEIYVRLTEADLVAGIVGGARRVFRRGDDFILDAAAASRDPDDPGGALNYTWSCHSGEVNANATNEVKAFSIVDCPPVLQGIYWTGANGTLDITTRWLALGSVTFRVLVSKGSRVAFADQTVVIKAGYVPELNFRCLQNCGQKVGVSRKLSLEVLCPTCNTLQDLVYTWNLEKFSLGSYQSIGLDNKTDTGTNREGIVILPNRLFAATTYRLVFELSCSTCALNISMSYVFSTSSPPEGGTCSVSPTVGEAIRTSFVISCPGWIAGGGLDVPLSYRYLIDDPASETGSSRLLYYGAQASTPPLPFTSGSAEKDYLRKIIVEISDINGGMTSMSLSVKVSPPDWTAGSLTDEITKKLQAAAALTSSSTKQKAQLISTLSSALNSANDITYGTFDTSSQDTLRTEMISSLADMTSDVKDSDDVIMISQALADSANGKQRIGGENKLKAAGALSEMGNSFQTLSSNGGDDTQSTAAALLLASWNLILSRGIEPASFGNLSEALIESGELSPREYDFYIGLVIKEQTQKQNEENEVSKEVTSLLLALQEGITDDVLDTMVAGESPVTIQTGDAMVKVQKQRIGDFSSLEVSTNSSTMKFSSEVHPNASNAVITSKVSSFSSNPLTWGGNSSLVKSDVHNISLFNDGASSKPVLGDSNLEITFSNSETTIANITVNVTALADNETGLTYHRVELDYPGENVILRLYPPEGNSAVALYFRKGATPTARENQYVGYAELNGTSQTLNAIVPGQYVTSAGTYYIGLRFYEDGNVVDRKRRDTSSLTSDDTYTISITSTSCRYWDAESEDWIIGGQVDQTKTTMDQTTCTVTSTSSSSVNYALAATFLTPPNSIDFKTVFAKLDIADNGVVIITVVAVLVLYIVFLMIMVRADRQDLQKWCMEPLADNDDDELYLYKITIVTSFKWNAGTTSCISFALYGELGDTGPRMLIGTTKDTFPTGSTRVFIMRTEGSLGVIRKLRIWHDNSGSGGKASWCVDNITVEDIQKDRKFTFICDKWLTANPVDPEQKTYATFSTARKAQTASFPFIWRCTTRLKITDGHLWLSVFLRPFGTSFTRAQRLSCCVSILYLTMLANAMFYRTTDEDIAIRSDYYIRIGSLFITLNEVLVSLMGVAIVFPIGSVVVLIFRRVNLALRENLVLQASKDLGDSVLIHHYENREKEEDRYSWMSDFSESDHGLPLEESDSDSDFDWENLFISLKPLEITEYIDDGITEEEMARFNQVDDDMEGIMQCKARRAIDRVKAVAAITGMAGGMDDHQTLNTNNNANGSDESEIENTSQSNSAGINNGPLPEPLDADNTETAQKNYAKLDSEGKESSGNTKARVEISKWQANKGKVTALGSFLVGLKNKRGLGVTDDRPAKQSEKSPGQFTETLDSDEEEQLGNAMATAVNEPNEGGDDIATVTAQKSTETAQRQAHHKKVSALGKFLVAMKAKKAAAQLEMNKDSTTTGQCNMAPQTDNEAPKESMEQFSESTFQTGTVTMNSMASSRGKIIALGKFSSIAGASSHSQSSDLELSPHNTKDIKAESHLKKALAAVDAASLVKNTKKGKGWQSERVKMTALGKFLVGLKLKSDEEKAPEFKPEDILKKRTPLQRSLDAINTVSHMNKRMKHEVSLNLQNQTPISLEPKEGNLEDNVLHVPEPVEYYDDPSQFPGITPPTREVTFGNMTFDYRKMTVNGEIRNVGPDPNYIVLPQNMPDLIPAAAVYDLPQEVSQIHHGGVNKVKVLCNEASQPQTKYIKVQQIRQKEVDISTSTKQDQVIDQVAKKLSKVMATDAVYNSEEDGPMNKRNVHGKRVTFQMDESGDSPEQIGISKKGKGLMLKGQSKGKAVIIKGTAKKVTSTCGESQIEIQTESHPKKDLSAQLGVNGALKSLFNRSNQKSSKLNQNQGQNTSSGIPGSSQEVMFPHPPPDKTLTAQQGVSGALGSLFSNTMSILPQQASVAGSSFAKNQRFEEERKRINSYEKKTMSKTVANVLLIIAWTLCLTAMLVSAFFVMVYSIEWGREKSNTWLIAYVMSFVEGLVIMDPIKVLVLSLVISVMVWKVKSREEEDILLDQEKKRQAAENKDLPEYELQKAKERAEMARRARHLLVDLTATVVFVWLSLSLGYGFAGPESHRAWTSLNNNFAQGFKNEVTDADSFFTWLEVTFVPMFFLRYDFTGQKLHWQDRLFTSDLTSFRVGPARLRQIRAPQVPCVEDLPISICRYDVNYLYDDASPFGPMNESHTLYNSSVLAYTSGGWFYNQSSDPSQNIPLLGVRELHKSSGFMVDLDINRDVSLRFIRELKQYNWVDRQTRALFVEFTVFNSNTDQFAFITLLAEFPATGGVLHFSTIKLFRAYSLGFFSIYLYFCSGMILLYFIFHTVFMFKELKDHGKKHFRTLRWWIDLLLFVLICIWLSAYVGLSTELAATISLFQADKSKYVHFATVAFAHEMYRYSVGFLNCLGMIKLVSLLYLSKRIALFGAVLSKGMASILGCGVEISIFMCGYATLGYLYYGSALEDFRSFSASLSYLVCLGLGDFDLTEMLSMNTGMTGVYFITFVMLINYVMINLLISTILFYHDRLKHRLRPPSDHELLRELLGKAMTGLRAITKAANKRSL